MRSTSTYELKLPLYTRVSCRKKVSYRSYDSFVNSWICNWSLLWAGELDTRLTRINWSDLAILVLIDGPVML